MAVACEDLSLEQLQCDIEVMLRCILKRKGPVDRDGFDNSSKLRR